MLQAQRAALPSLTAAPDPAALDMGPLPASQMLTLTLHLDPGAERAASLDALIASQLDPGSPEYRHWITPAEVAARFGTEDTRIAAVAAWLDANGLSVIDVSPSKLRMTVTGSSARVMAAFGVQLHQYLGAPGASGNRFVYFASTGAASVPQAIAALLSEISGLDDRLPAWPMQLRAFPANGASEADATTTDPLESIEEAVDANAAATLTIDTHACSTGFAPADVAAWRTVLKQAAAQGITVIATAGCASGAFPASLPELTAIAAPAVPAASAPFAGIAPRPQWQLAEGLPYDGWREAPDVAVASVPALAATLATIAQRVGTRLGNIAPVLYELAKSPDLYTHTDTAAPGVWEPSDGLGVVDLKRLAEDYPAGTTGTSSLLTVSNYAPYHGQPLTLTATVTSTGGSGIPTGTVTFTSTQKGTLGTATLNASGGATFTTNSLQAGTYTTTSVYGGNTNYLGSTSGVATITVLGEPSLITAAVEPGAAVGGDAAIDVSVTSASGVGTPSGTVTVAPQGTTNPATATATLAGTNGTATATVLLPVYQAGQFTLLVSCADPDPSFTCYSPVSLQMIVAKGATATALTVAPADPVAGATYTLTATVSGTGTTAAASNAARHGGSRRAASRSTAAPLDTSAYTGPTGNVQFADGTQYLATAALTNGVATYTGTSTSGTHTFSAMYSGDANYGTSSSNSSAASGTTPTSTSIAASASSIGAGQSVTFTATVASAGLPPTMSGTVTFTAAAQGVLGTAAVAKGVATLTLATLAAGSYSVTATYSGDSVFAASTSAAAVNVSVAASATATAIVSNVSSALSGVQVLFTATVSAGAAAAAPTGTVTFFASYGSVLSELGTAALAGQGVGSSAATLSVSTLAAGAYSVYAVYGGDTRYSGSTSAAINFNSTGYAAAFAPATVTLTPGQSGQATLTVTYLGGFTGTVSLACTPPPNTELTCSFSPATLAAAGTATLTIVTTAPSSASASAAIPPRPGSRQMKIATGVALAMLLIWIRPGRLPRRLLLLLAAIVMAGATGCGGTNLAHTSSPGTPGDPGTPLGTQVLSITTAGSDGTNTVRHDLQYQVTVQ
jgi:hypothetical protein